MGNEQKYVIRMEPDFGFLKLIDVPALIEACTDKWYNQTLCKVNGCLVRLGIFDGEFHWHKHDNEDEFFFVLSGELLVDFEAENGNETVILQPHQGLTVPSGVNHRTYVKTPTTVLMVEGSTVTPTGDI